ncbi:MAG: hypothetical protein LBC19_13715 [Tannerella sp.]|nr:hypothetical protein [Tannerella sp.]
MNCQLSSDCPKRADDFIPKADLDTKNIDLHTANEVNFRIRKVDII